MLTQSSNIFQRIAIGWEQIEYEKTDSYYKDQFTRTQFRIKNVSYSNKLTSICLLFLMFFFFRFRRCVN